MEQEKKVPTLDEIKECIGFDPHSELHRSLSGLVDCWYKIAKRDGKSEEAALNETLDKFGKKLLSYLE